MRDGSHSSSVSHPVLLGSVAAVDLCDANRLQKEKNKLILDLYNRCYVYFSRLVLKDKVADIFDCPHRSKATMN